jgi:hypothetical protein
MKGFLALALVLTLTGAAAFAELPAFQLSAGGGIMAGFEGSPAIIDWPSFKLGYDFFSFGGFLFFDATFAELSVGFSGGTIWRI